MLAYITRLAFREKNEAARRRPDLDVIDERVVNDVHELSSMRV